MIDLSGFFKASQNLSTNDPMSGADGADRDKKLTENYHRNSVYAKPGKYFTELDPKDEMEFRRWIHAKKVPFAPNAKIQDYDMRGFWHGMRTGNERAKSSINPTDGKIHYPDYWKTPWHETFSDESQWAAAGAPSWNQHGQLSLPNGQILFGGPEGRQGQPHANPWK